MRFIWEIIPNVWKLPNRPLARAKSEIANGAGSKNEARGKLEVFRVKFWCNCCRAKSLTVDITQNFLEF